MKLNQDKRSTVKTDKIYGKRGDRVKVISQSGTLAIVENEAGERFPAQADQLEEEKQEGKLKSKIN